MSAVRGAEGIVGQGAVAFTLKIAGAALAFLLHVVLARTLGVEGAGLYFLAFTIVTLGSLVTRLGVENAVTRYVAAHAAQSDWGTVDRVVRIAARMTLGCSVLGALLLFGFADLIARRFFDDQALASPLRWMALAMPPLTLLFVYAKALLGLKKAATAMTMQSVLPPLLACCGALLLAPRFGPSGGAIAYTIAAAVTVLYGVRCWMKLREGWNVSGASQIGVKGLLSSSTPLLGAMLLQQAIQAIPLLLLGHLASVHEVGLFSVAQKTAALIALVLIAANVVVAPRFAEYYQKRDMRSLDRTARAGAAMMTLMAAPAALLFMIMPQEILALFGAGFPDGSASLRILAAAQFINVMSGSVGILLVMTGQELSALTANFTAFIICIVLSILLIPQFGATGAAIAAAIPLAVVNLIRVRFVWQTMGVLTLPLLAWKKK